ncbi:UTP--glucose-1-phosphate uridylyltransferase 2-like [Schistocerca gregaria]|uniref:UTP--glucose-1-phosphate uridylyltransferase 2-like n=1 Tax=Schistocerca gregaria TaxID=7010 RepID=UPI00211E61B4|nr:UTP--glucose-1-phosphate uridylyltransferase 2-like [Schistocerca gregaria]
MHFEKRYTSLENLCQTEGSLQINMHNCIEQLVSTCYDRSKCQVFSKEMQNFEHLFKKYLSYHRQVIDWASLNPPDNKFIIPLHELPQVVDYKEIANELCILKLNGGLGTTMGCVGPKSAIEVRDTYTFLDLNVKQIEYLNARYNSDVPLILMNSFNTHDETISILNKYKKSSANILTFNQSRYPRIYKDSLTPMPQSYDAPASEWYPPGHGDVFHSLYDSGLLQVLLDKGKKYLFISNIDNLAATVNFNICHHMKESGSEFLMEVTDRTRADIKGGTLVEYKGQLKLLEIAQVPAEHINDFKSIKRFKIFNTNNLWISIEAIKRVVESGVLKDIDVISNVKEINGKNFIQLETAAGAAIHFFKNAHGINVPRDRFLPVKSTSDLLVVQSDLYNLSHGTLTMNPLRQFGGVPIVKLGAEFKSVSSYNQRFAGIPNMLELDQLTVAGDVVFGTNIILKGIVIIVANHGARIDLPSGSLLENKVVTGELHILDH